MIVFIDTSVLGLLCNPNSLPDAVECQAWSEKLLARATYLVTSELCDYELRRGLVLAQKTGSSDEGIKILDNLRILIDFLPFTQNVAQIASELWANARLQSQPTADENNIDVDMIISAHWKLLKAEFPGRYVVVSTTNIRHLQLFTEAQEWREIAY
jgi:predicted nucleic acid-binding protein